jgi:hypothetical protein
LKTAFVVKAFFVLNRLSVGATGIDANPFAQLHNLIWLFFTRCHAPGYSHIAQSTEVPLFFPWFSTVKFKPSALRAIVNLGSARWRR